MSYAEVLKMPLRTFWSFNRQVDRLRAEAEQRQFRLLGAVQDAESSKQLAGALQSELGAPMVTVKEFDADKFEELKQAMK